MALPVGQMPVSSAFNDVWNALINLRSYCLGFQSSTSGGASASLSEAVQIASWAVTFRTVTTTYQEDAQLWAAIVTHAGTATAISGLTAQDFQAAYDAAGSLLTALTGEFPHDAQGRLLHQTFSLTLGLQVSSRTAVQMPNTMTAITNFLATLS